MSLNAIKTIRLVIGAAELDAAECEIPPEHVAGVEAARAELALMRGVDVIDAVMAIHKAGLSLALDLRPTVRIANEISRRPSVRF